MDALEPAELRADALWALELCDRVTAMEAGVKYSIPCREAVTGAQRIDAVFACQPGDSFWGTEFSRAFLRNASRMPEPLRVLIAGEGLGDAGAGTGSVMSGVALHRARWRQAGGRRRLVHGSADGGRVGACVVEMIRSSQEEA